MGEDRLDKFMKDKVFNHKTPTDPDLLWQGIQAKQNANKKPKRRFLLFWIFAGALLFISAASLYFLSYGKADLSLKAKNELSNPVENNSSIKQTATNTTPETEVLINKNNTKSNSTEKTTTDTAISPINTSSKNPSSLFNKQVVNNKASSKKTKSSNTKSALATNITQAQKTASPSTSNTKATDSSTILKSIATNQGSTEVVNAFEKTSTDSPGYPGTEKEITPASNPLESLTNKEIFNNSQQSIDVVSLGILLEIPDFAKTAGAKRTPIISKKKEENSIKPNVPTSPFSIGGHFAYGFANRQLSAKSTENQQYIYTRDSMETARQVLSGGLDFQWQHKTGLYAKTGLYYEQINERFDFDSLIIKTGKYKEDLVTQIYYLMDGSTSISTGDTTIEHHTHTREIYNRYRTFDIPLLLGYSPISDKRWNWFVEGGVLINVSFFPRGEILNAKGEIVNLEEDSRLLKTSTGLSFTGAAGFSYRLNKRWTLWASPVIRYQISSITAKENLLDQQYLRGALQVGLRMRL